MSETWIKIRHNLTRSPRVFELARALKTKHFFALGAMVSWLVWLDEQSANGATGLTPKEVDSMLGIRGFSAALQSIGWIEVQDGMVHALDFDKHCGDSAKKRAENLRRQDKSRANLSRENRDKCHAKSVTNVTDFCDKSVTRERVREKDIKEKDIKEIDNVADEPVPRPPVISYPKSVDEVKAYMEKLPLRTISGKELDECSSSFFESMAERGWLTKSYPPVPVRDWKAPAGRFLRVWQARLGSLSPSDPKVPSRGQKMRISGCNDPNDYVDAPDKLTRDPELDDNLPF